MQLNTFATRNLALSSKCKIRKPSLHRYDDGLSAGVQKVYRLASVHRATSLNAKMAISRCVIVKPLIGNCDKSLATFTHVNRVTSRWNVPCIKDQKESERGQDVEQRFLGNVVESLC